MTTVARRDPSPLDRPVVEATLSAAEIDERLNALLLAAARGDERAFAELYDATNTRVKAVVLRILCAVDHAAEVTQEVYADVWRQADQYDRHRGSIWAWMSTIAHRRAIDRVRSVSTDTARDDRYARETESRAGDLVWAEVERVLSRDQVRHALGMLAPPQREAIVLAYFRGYTQVQAAELLQIPLGTVKTRIRAGLTQLRKDLGTTETP